MRIHTFIGIAAIPLSATSEPFITQFASAFTELRAALSPCSTLQSNPAVIPHPTIPNLWIVPHNLPSGSWENKALIAVGASRLYTENHDIAALLHALSNAKKIAEWNEIIAGDLGLSSRKPFVIDTEKLEVALDGIPFNAQWISDLSQTLSPEQTVFLITQDTDWAVVTQTTSDCSILIHSQKTAAAPASLTPLIQKVLAR